MTSNLPPGVTESMIPGNRPEDEEIQLTLTFSLGEIDHFKEFNREQLALPREERHPLWAAITNMVEQFETLDTVSNIEEQYWRERCQLAENYIDESPCDPDITDKQRWAHKLWQDKIKEKEMRLGKWLCHGCGKDVDESEVEEYRDGYCHIVPIYNERKKDVDIEPCGPVVKRMEGEPWKSE